MNDNQNMSNTSNTNNVNVVNNEIKTDFSDKRQDVKNVKLKRFNYKVKDASGKIVSDYFDAEKEQDVVAFLTQKGFNVVSITEDKLSTGLGLVSMNFSSKMNAKDLNFFLTQLSTYIKSGIPLVDSMEILSRQTKKRETRNLYKRIVFELNRGVSFSNCLEKQGKVFPKMLINMLRTSEMTGDLTGVLDDMALHYKQQDSNRKQIISAMTYPSVLMVFAVAVLTFIITYVVPSFTDMYKSISKDLPKITVIIMNLSSFVIKYWYYIVAVILVVVIVLALLYKGSKGAKYFMQSFVMHIPVVKNLIIYNQLVVFTSTFANLIKHDVFITDSMDILSKITDNEIYKKLINNAINDLSKGNGVSPAFKGHWAFPDTAYEMLVTGEKTGKLGEMLFHVSDYYQEEQTNMIARMKSLIEPIMIILLAVLVGIILLSVVIPMFDVYSGII
ncbi:MAG: type II secretion system F family protein [Bacilli bacterium]|nr:type II secretion system F family protein [Bacilli bacterium]